MEAVLQRQQELIKEIERIHINFKKDSATRKSSDYITKRLEALDNLWGEFYNNNQNLENNPDKLSEYYTRNIYKQINEYYNVTRKMIATYEEKASTSSTSRANETKFEVPSLFVENSEVEDLLIQQKTNLRALQRQVKRIDIVNIDEKWEIEDELKTLQHRWNKIDEMHLRLERHLQGEDDVYNTEFIESETLFINMKKELNRKLCSTAHLRQSVPQIEIPVFTGNYTQWPTFYDLFVEAIHKNKYLSDAQKMQHLKGKVKGEAERLIQHLHISSENYESAWEILVHRYNNPQVLFSKHIEILLNQPVINKQTSIELKRLHDTTTECIHAIHNLDIDTNSWDPLLVHILCKKLDAETYSSYKEARNNPRELPSLSEFMTFIEGKFTALEPISKNEEQTKRQSYPPPQTSTNKQIVFNKQTFKYQGRYPNKQYQVASTLQRKQYPCPLCNYAHHLYTCKQFLSIPKEEVMDTIAKNKICPNCLFKHYEMECKSDKRCKECNGKHNTYIHDAAMYNKQPRQQAMNMTPPSTSSAVSTNSTRSPVPQKQYQANYVSNENEEILLTTISIKIKSIDGTYIKMNALLDQGSQISLISENAAQLLGLQRKHYHASVSGIGPSIKQSRGIVTLECESIYEDYQFTTEALIISRVINNLPTSTFNKQTWSHLQHVKLADPEYNVSKPIDLLLDASVYSDIIMSGLIKGPSHAPIAQQTRLGWILSGNVRTFHCNVIINHLDDIKKYWELEDINEPTSNLTEEEQFCENFYQSTTRRLENGKYEVALPMKPEFEQQLGSSKSKAIAQFLQQERKMAQNKDLSEGYKQFMKDYINQGHMRKVEVVENPSCYLPHHSVIKLDSSTTALRVVFNASSKTSSGKSLNDLMECGPNLQQDLQSLIINWRQFRYVITADIEKMFRQILVRQEDQPLQTIIWRESPNKPIEQYHLTTVTYGTKAAPFLAMRTLKQIARDANKYEMAASALENSFYMDDLMSGHNSLEQAKLLQKQLIEVLKSSGMNLRKWSSNEQKLIQDLSPDQLNTPLLFKDTDTRKALGLQWNPSTDTFTFQNKLEEQTEDFVTKRQFLSDISKIYDPLGWLSPITIRCKLIFQQTWMQPEMSWDDKLNTNIQKEWLKLKGELMSIGNFAIPRYLGHITNNTLVLHGFCDASEKAYACAIYIVTRNNKGESISRLVTAKTKVAPTNKTISLPRLELLGALLLSQLFKKVINALSTSHSTIDLNAWTDSMIVLGWIHGDVSKWKQFVANRVQQIKEVIPSSSWRHVKSEENAADCASRGITSEELTNHTLWWEGPTWLTSLEKANKSSILYEEPTIEIKKKMHHVNTALCDDESNSIIMQLLNNKSSITHIVKILAWILRYKPHPLRARVNFIEQAELQESLNKIIITVQRFDFAEEIRDLNQKGHVKHSSKLSNLNPFIDDKGILRVGGRLEHADLHYSAKHPIILSPSSRFTELIIQDAHSKTLHGGPKLTLTFLRDIYWIISGIRTVKKQLRLCVKCQKFKQETKTQIMADLPPQRVTPSRPFTNTGVDFTGHLEIKSNKGRGVRTSKGYVAVFVCLATKAVHLELVSDLSTASFLAAFRRMCARRGTPKHIFSDNGTNFVGASRELKREYEAILQTINTDFIKNVTEMGVTWHFNCPGFPSGTGLIEAAVKSCKYHLKRVLGTQKLTYEEFATLLYQIEACLNSRPLCALSESQDEDYLTPGHFLVGGPLLSRPQTDPDIINMPERWKLIQSMNKQIWKKWSSEYLQQLQIRSKWRYPKKNVEIGDIVIIKDENSPPGKWPMGRVCEVHPGKDGNTRVVSLKTQNNIIKRPVIKLVVLPVNGMEPSQKPTGTAMEDQPTSRTVRQRKTPFKSFFMTMLLLLFSMISSSYQESFNVTEITSENFLYFDKMGEVKFMKDHWTMVVYYNMTTYWQGVSQLESYIEHLNKACQKDKLCCIISMQFQHELNEIKHYNELLTRGNPKREKRGLINGIGNIANSLFGILDDNFAEQYHQDIESVRDNNKHLLKLIKNQTSILEVENNILHRNEKLMNDQFAIINQLLNNLTDEISQAELMSKNAFAALYIISNAISVDVMLSNLRRIQETLLQTVTDIYQGRLDVHLLSPQQLQEQLTTISSHLKDDLCIPVKPNEISKLHQLLRMKTKVKNNYLLIELKIPLTNSEKYELDYIVSLPQKIEKITYQTSQVSDYIAFNIKKDTFVPLSNSDLTTCIKYDQNFLLCNLNCPIYELHRKGSICDVDIMTHKNNQTFCTMTQGECNNKWIKLHSDNSWLYSCCEECLIRILCPAGLMTRSLRGNGILTLTHDCIVKGDTFTIQGHHDYRNEVEINSPMELQKLADISVLNSFIPTKISDIKLQPLENHSDDYNRIQQQIKIAKEAEDLDSVSSVHHIHHYAMIYVTLCILIFGALGCCLRKRCGTKSRSQGQTQTAVGCIAASSGTEQGPSPSTVKFYTPTIIEH